MVGTWKLICLISILRGQEGFEVEKKEVGKDLLFSSTILQAKTLKRHQNRLGAC